MSRKRVLTAAEMDAQVGEKLVDKPTEAQGGEKGFKYEKNAYGHVRIRWEDGSSDVPVDLMGSYTSLSKAKHAVQMYLDSRRAPRGDNLTIQELIR